MTDRNAEKLPDQDYNLHYKANPPLSKETPPLAAAPPPSKDALDTSLTLWQAAQLLDRAARNFGHMLSPTMVDWLQEAAQLANDVSQTVHNREGSVELMLFDAWLIDGQIVENSSMHRKNSTLRRDELAESISDNGGPEETSPNNTPDHIADRIIKLFRRTDWAGHNAQQALERCATAAVIASEWATVRATAEEPMLDTEEPNDTTERHYGTEKSLQELTGDV